MNSRNVVAICHFISFASYFTFDSHFDSRFFAGSIDWFSGIGSTTKSLAYLTVSFFNSSMSFDDYRCLIERTMDKIHFKLNAMQSKHWMPKSNNMWWWMRFALHTFLHSCITFIKWIVITVCDCNYDYSQLLQCKCILFTAIFEMIKITTIISLNIFLLWNLQNFSEWKKQIVLIR